MLVALFERCAGILVPTALCEHFVLSSARIEKELRALSRYLWEPDAPLYGRVRIAFQAPTLERKFADWSEQIMRQQPFLTISWEHTVRQDIFSGLEKGRFDIGVTSLAGLAVWPRLTSQVMDHDYYLCLSPHGTEECEDVFAQWHRYQNFIWLLTVKGMAMRDFFDNRLRALGLAPPKRIIEINSMLGASNIFSRLDAATVITRSMLTASPQTFAPAPHLPHVSELGIVWNSYRKLSIEAQFVLNILRA